MNLRHRDVLIAFRIAAVHRPVDGFVIRWRDQPGGCASGTNQCDNDRSEEGGLGHTVPRERALKDGELYGDRVCDMLRGYRQTRNYDTSHCFDVWRSWQLLPLRLPILIFSAERFKAHVTFLADDLLEGREAGTRVMRSRRSTLPRNSSYSD
jgi:hypothetical protein